MENRANNLEEKIMFGLKYDRESSGIKDFAAEN